MWPARWPQTPTARARSWATPSSSSSRRAISLAVAGGLADELGGASGPSTACSSRCSWRSCRSRTPRRSSCACTSRCSPWLVSVRRSAPIVMALALAALLVPVAIPSWHVSLSTAFDDVTPVAIPVVALVVVRRRPGAAGQPRARRGASGARPPRGRERTLPDRPRPARSARPLADDDHRQSRPRAPARRGRSAASARRRSPRSRRWPGSRWPTCGPPSATTAT